MAGAVAAAQAASSGPAEVSVGAGRAHVQGAGGLVGGERNRVERGGPAEADRVEGAGGSAGARRTHEDGGGEPMGDPARRSRVVVVDSGSTDATADLAAEAGAEVIRGPLGKGAAMRLAASFVDTPWVCFLDADLVETSHNIAAVLRERALGAGDEVAMIVGEFTDPPPEPVLGNTIALYPTLVRALFPEADGRFGRRPLSGFRVVRPELVADVPDDFGVEAHLNLTVAVSGRPFIVTPIGMYRQRFRYKPDMGREIGKAILDVAIAHGRLAPPARPAWDHWVAWLAETMGSYRGDLEDRDAYLAHLMAAAAAPLPPTGVK
ncbi:glycosyltransferase family 2 protein [Acrocarpospora corrugata]|uniref:glycosyltransferase family 2 protein n=1 Tax=Acrocarpospora corrugata TaxID=35763 RepID=UPI001478BE71|nr:glycosyltransferase [Acrocarpospora corrugata]